MRGSVGIQCLATKGATSQFCLDLSKDRGVGLLEISLLQNGSATNSGLGLL